MLCRRRMYMIFRKERGKLMMKRNLSLIMAMLMAIFCLLPGSAGADSAAATNSVDIVILVDNSKSMDDRATQGASQRGNSDPHAYRYDAAEMLVGMCDVNGSRVAYVPFAEKVMTGKTVDRVKYLYADTQFQDISNADARKHYIQRLDTDRAYVANDPSQLIPNTDFGAALRYAVDLINNRGAAQSGNQPMIVLLTDGSNNLGNNIKVTNWTNYTWNTREKKFDTQSVNKQYTAEEADRLADEATKACAQLGIPIYTIILAESEEKADKEAAKKLQQISDDTLAMSLSLYGNAEELPNYFGELFADRIGSRIQKNLYPRMVNDEYVIDIPILNKSIQELNILVPMKSVDSNSIALYDGSVNITGRDDINVFYGSENSNFRLYKITNPRSLGIWQLRFKPKNKNSATRISLSMVFNYNLDMVAKIGKQPDQLTDGDFLTLGKNDTLYVESLFLDSRTGEPSTDLDLYMRNADRHLDRSIAVQDWWEIKATCTIIRIGETEPVSSRLNGFEIPSVGDRFYGEIPLRLSAGDYQVKIHVEGAGISRETVKTLKLTNNGPDVENISQVRYVDYASGASLPENAVQGPDIRIKLNDNAQDVDHDDMTFTLVEEDAQTELVTGAQIVSDGTDRYFAGKVAGEAGSYASGVYTRNIRVADVDGAYEDMKITVTIISGIEVAKKGSFPAYLEMDGDSATRTDLTNDMAVPINKNTAVRQYIQYSRPAGDRDTTVGMEDFTFTLALKDARESVVESPVLQQEGGKYFFAFSTPRNETDWTAEWTVSYLGQEIGRYAYTVSIGNQPPEIIDGLGGQVDMHISFNELPAFLNVLNAVEGNTPEEELNIDLKKVFYDPNRDDNLTFRTSIEPDGAVEINDPNAAGILKITPKAEGEISFTITAEDSDRQTAVRTYTVTVKDLTKMWTLYGLIALGALALLIVVICVIHQARKPVFPPLQLEIHEGNALNPSGTFDLPPQKKPLSMAYPLAEIVDKYGIHDVTLQFLILIPIRSNDTIQIARRKKIGSEQILLEGRELGKHPVNWTVGQTLELRSAPDRAEFLRVVLTNPQAMTSSSAGGGFDISAGDSFDDGLGGTSASSDPFGSFSGQAGSGSAGSSGDSDFTSLDFGAGGSKSGDGTDF